MTWSGTALNPPQSFRRDYGIYSRIFFAALKIPSIIKRHKEIVFQNFDGSNDVLQLLLKQAQRANEIKSVELGANTRRKTLSSREIANNCFAFLLAGYETTSTALGFSAWLLAKNIDKQVLLQQEIDEHLSVQVSSGILRTLLH